MNNGGMKKLLISPRDMRIAKLNKTVRPKPCSKELESFLSALEMFGDGKVPIMITKKLADCLEVKVYYFFFQL